jgi:hypothetical protein
VAVHLLDKRQAKSLKLRLRRLVNEWDPAGILSAGAPDDEYDCVTDPLLSLLSRSVSRSEIEHWLGQKVTDHFGLEISNDEISAFVEKLIPWYQEAVKP